MRRRDFLRRAAVAGAGAMAGGWGVTHGAAATPVRRPNLLVIVADDMGFSDAGCYGGEIATPNLDSLAAGGVRFTQGYSTGRCWPSRTCLLTGYYPQQVRMDPPVKGKPLPPWARVLPHYLKPLGYRTYHSGKWHLNNAPRPVRDGGFDRSYKIDDHDRYFAPRQATLDDQPLPPVSADSGFYLTTGIADYALGFLRDHARQHAEQPFLLYLAFTSPHFPLQALQADIDRCRQAYTDGWDVCRQRRWQRQRQAGIVSCDLARLEPDTVPGWNLTAAEQATRLGPGEVPRAVPWTDLTDEQKRFQVSKMAVHAAMVDRMDREVGRVLDQVRAMGAFDDTVIMFVSDNGASAEVIIRGDGHDPAAPPGSAKTFLCLGPGWSSASNTPFRLHKSWVHEGGIASPWIVHWPRGLAARGELRHNPVHFSDLLPTLVELAGGAVGGEWHGKPVPPLPGRSLVPALARDATVPHDYLYFHHLENRAVRVGDWKLVAAGRHGPWELYDLASDRCEARNLAAQEPERVKALSELWQREETAFRALAEIDDWPGPATPRAP